MHSGMQHFNDILHIHNLCLSLCAHACYLHAQKKIWMNTHQQLIIFIWGMRLAEERMKETFYFVDFYIVRTFK